MILYPTQKATRKNTLISQDYYGGANFYPQNFGTATHAAEDIVSGHGDSLLACEDMNPYKTYNLDNETLQQGLSKGFGVHFLTLPNATGISREWVYWHTQSNLQCSKDKSVKQGDVVAYEGDSGQVYTNGIAIPDDQKGKAPFPGTHVHWGYREVKRGIGGSHCLLNVDGSLYRDKDDMAYDVVNYDNGNKGFLDPMKLDIAFYDEWLERRGIIAVSEAVQILPQLPEKQQQSVGKILSNFLWSIINYLKK